MANIGLYTHLVAAAAYAVLGGLLLLHRRQRPLGPSLFVACCASAAWAATVALGTLAPYPPLTLLQLSEAIRNLAWLFVLLQLLGLQAHGDPWRWPQHAWRPAFAVAAFALVALASLRALRPALGWLDAAVYHNTMLAVWLLTALAGLLLIEQLYRNGTGAQRWSLKYLCLGVGTVMAYDFFMYAEALLFRQLDANLWQARGIVSALVTPWLAVAIARNRSWQVDLHVSRQVVFHTVTLTGAGIYLLGMATIGYFLRFLGGTWGGVLQVSFLAAALGLLASVLFSGRLRAKLRVWLSKHFFSYRYDYREEWLKFTRSLATIGDNVPEGIIATMAPLAGAPAGLLFSIDAEQSRLQAHWNMPPPDGRHAGLGNLRGWLAGDDWVIDLDERRRDPDLYEGLELPPWLDAGDLWLIIPLVFRDRLEGILMLRHSQFKASLNWEDRDLLKTAGRQAASHLAQYLASEALVEARQFDAFNRLSAYVIHDLKNILAQQSLIVSNAQKHRHNPAFVDDMIATVSNSVARMQRLMEQMRSGVRSAPTSPVNIAELLRAVVLERSGDHTPVPTLEAAEDSYLVVADRERLGTVFNHLVQNAQEATPSDGAVCLSLQPSADWVTITVSDTGRGMDATFIRDRLFTPFESTKGLTGMGIGVFESREYVRQLGGDIDVQSAPGAGTTFFVRLPMSEQGRREQAPDASHAA